jgi:hypothetical protein
MSLQPIERRIKWAGLLIVLGLLIQLITFLWIHPLAFVAFLVIGCPLVAAGVVLYLLSLVNSHRSPENTANRS